MTDQIGSRLDPIHAVVEQKVATWDGSAWSSARGPSSNPAAIFRAVARGWRTAAGELLAGAGLAADEVDDAVLGAWSAWCDAHEPRLECNLVIDSPMTVEALLGIVTRCGRASVSWATGKLGVVWERERPASAAITPERIVAGSVSVAWAGDQVADEVVLRYVDPAQDWAVRDVRSRPPGASGSAARTATIDGRGITNAPQAAALASLQAAHQALHRRRITWEMGPAGLALGRGGVTGRARGVRPRSVALDRDVDVPAGSTLLVTGPDGAQSQHAVRSAEGSPPVVVLDADLPAATAASKPEDVAWRLYATDEAPLELRLVAVEPLAEDRVRLSVIDETAEYHPNVDSAPDDTIEIAASGTHVWAGPGSTALVWLVSGQGGTGGGGGGRGSRGADGGPRNYHYRGGPGGGGGAGGQGGLHAAGGRAASGGTGAHGDSGSAWSEPDPNSRGGHIYFANGGEGGAGGGGGGGGAGSATTLTLGETTWTSGEGAGGGGDSGRGGFGAAGRGGSGGFTPGRSTRTAGRDGVQAIEVVNLTALSVGDQLVFTLGAGGRSGGHGGHGGDGAAAGGVAGRGSPASPADTSRAAGGRAIILPT